MSAASLLRGKRPKKEHGADTHIAAGLHEPLLGDADAEEVAIPRVVGGHHVGVADEAASHRPTAASSAFGNLISLVELVAQISKSGPNVLELPCGGVEARPCLGGDDIAHGLRMRGFSSLLQLLSPASARPAIMSLSTDGRPPLLHSGLAAFVEQMSQRMWELGVGVGQRVGVLLPNGPEMAMCLLVCLSTCVAVPMNYQQTVAEVKAELQRTRATAVVIQDGEDDKGIRQAAEEIGVRVIKLCISPEAQGCFTLEAEWMSQNAMRGAEGERAARRKPLATVLENWRPGGSQREEGERARRSPVHEGRHNSPCDIAMVLQTSGTSGTRKTVTYTLENLIVGASCIIHSWGLTHTDVAMNMMPLFHIGGISRNLLASVLAGGGVVCSRGFDPTLFWQSAPEFKVTWYYAGPTMHQLLLEEIEGNPPDADGGKLPPGCRIRMVCNASGGLLPSLATRLKQAFGCVVLPSYGMTECMPISTPPLQYSLDRSGTSGVMCGPHARVYAPDGVTVRGPREVGNVCLKGLPLMSGYEGAEAVVYGDGWFDTGDMGYICEEGWLYLTGRSKEVINRGGEIISPFEVEEALAHHPRVQAVLAFSAPHDVLQEVVGCVIVPRPGAPRVDLIGLQKFAATCLHPSKWPQVIVFMPALPLSSGNKISRIHLARRFGIGAVRETEAQTQRMFEACAPHSNSSGSGNDTPILTRVVGVDLQEVMRVFKLVQRGVGFEHCVVVSGHHQHRKDAVCAYLTPKRVDVAAVEANLRQHLHDYLIPIELITIETLPTDPGCLPLPTLKGLLHEYIPPASVTEAVIQDIWTDVLGGTPPSVHADFFEHGGTSLLAGRMIARVRGALGVPMTAASIFQSRTIATLARNAEAMGARAPVGYVYSNTQLGQHGSGHGKGTGSVSVTPPREPFGGVGGSVGSGGEEAAAAGGDSGEGGDADMRKGRSERITALLVQALPLTVMYPLRRIATWMVFVSVWLNLQVALRINRLEALLVALACERLIAEMALPWIGILLKWTVIGRYRAGTFRMWGNYYLRWWFVDQALQLCGRGLFRHTQWGLRAYYTLLGAKIGRGCKLDARARIAECDLVCVGDGCMLDDVCVRAFSLEGGRMRLARVELGEGVCVCTKVSVVPGIRVPAQSCLGPLSSTYENMNADVRRSDRLFCTQTFGEPGLGYMLFGWLLVACVWIICQLPLLLVLREMCLQPWYKEHLNNYGDVLEWFLTPDRVGYYLALRVVRAVVQPFIRLGLGIALKWLVVGRFTAGKRCRSGREKFKHWFMPRLLPCATVHDACQLLGVHYGGVSVVFRLLGAKVGQRVYWPGSGFQGLVEYDLLTVGDDVIFGSRSVIMCCDAEDALPVCIEAGANIADRCVLLPGCTVGRNTVLGSGGLAAKGCTLPAGSKYVGSRDGAAVLLEAGNGSDADGSAPTMKPFGKAMYMREAKYFVYPAWSHALHACVFKAFTVCFRALTLTGALCMTSIVLKEEGLMPVEVGYSDLAVMLAPMYVVVQNVGTIVALVLAVWSKWLIMGHRKAGDFDWDVSPYCQRWQIYLSFTALIRNAYFGRGLLEYLQGSVYLVWYFRALGARIGRDVCLYPTGADPMMTEPELVTIGDSACVDNASLIAHINSLGRFSLNPVEVGPRATLRANSRLLSGSTMKVGSTLLEHTLIMGGEVVDAGSTWQGWPGQMVAITEWSASSSASDHSGALDSPRSIGRTQSESVSIQPAEGGAPGTPCSMPEGSFGSYNKSAHTHVRTPLGTPTRAGSSSSAQHAPSHTAARSGRQSPSLSSSLRTAGGWQRSPDGGWLSPHNSFVDMQNSM